jgi:hypothetical protein
MKRRARLRQLPKQSAKTRKRAEQYLQRAVVEHLTIRPAPGIFWCHYPAGGARRPIEAKIFKSISLKRGIPDLLLVKSGKLCALELKSERGRLSKVQKRCHDELRQAGAIVQVADNIDDAVSWLQKLGFLRGTTQ